MTALTDRIQEKVDWLFPQLVAWRRHFHEHPELSFQEQETAAFVYDRLADFGGYELSRPTETSVVARLITGRPGPTLALRADMDALPIQEENALDFASKIPGVMHACGHDGHTAMLLGAAKLLAEQRSSLRGELRLFFQHAEELFPGGGQQLVDAGVMEGVDTVVGAHLGSSLPTGKIGVCLGAMMAAPDTFSITVVGSGGHAAHPNQTVDSVAIAAQVITNLQHIVARNIDPLDSIVVSVTQLQAGTADNVIPGSAWMGGTVRSLDPALRDSMPQRLERVVRGICEAHGAHYSFEYRRGYRPVINDATVTEWVAEVVRSELGGGALRGDPAEHGRRGLLGLSAEGTRQLLHRRIGKSRSGERLSPPSPQVHHRRGGHAQRGRRLHRFSP